jgi:hypothetical protein
MSDMWLVYSPGGEIPTFEGIFETEADAKTVAEQIGGQYDPVKRYAAGDTSLHDEHLWWAAGKAVFSQRVICYYGEREYPVARCDSDGDLYERTVVGVNRAERETNTLYVSTYAETGDEAKRLLMAKIRDELGPEVDSWEVRNV